MSSGENLTQESLSKTMRVFLLFATIIIISITVTLMFKKQPEITQVALQQEIQSLQQQLPIKIDAHTELQNVEARRMEIEYSFMVTDGSTQQAGISVKEDNFAQQIEAAVKTSACQNKNTRRYINSEVSLSYRYVNADDIPIADFVVPAGFCKK